MRTKAPDSDAVLQSMHALLPLPEFLVDITGYIK